MKVKCTRFPTVPTTWGLNRVLRRGCSLTLSSDTIFLLTIAYKHEHGFCRCCGALLLLQLQPHTPTRPTTVGYRLDLDNDSRVMVLTVSLSPRTFFSLLLHNERYLCTSQPHETLLSITATRRCNPSIRCMYVHASIRILGLRVIDSVIIFNDLYLFLWRGALWFTNDECSDERNV